MSPDLEWRVDDPSGEQTIAKTTPPRPPRWRGWAIGLAVMLGIGLGVLYRSIPEPDRPAPPATPSPAIVPTPTPTAMPAALYQTIAREAQALATGDQAAFNQILDVQDFERSTELTTGLKAWGTPTAGALYSILDFQRPAEDKAWIEIKQFHIDRYVQETRFYRLRNGQWRRTDFDPSFWSGLVETNETPHFNFIYAIEDYALIEPIATLLEGDYEQVCADLACPMISPACLEAFGRQWCSPFERTLTVTLDLRGRIQPDAVHVTDTDGLIFHLSSPRVTNPIDPADHPHSIRNPIAWLHVMHLAYGTVTFQGSPPPGRNLVIAIFFREYDRLLARTGDPPLVQPADMLRLDTTHLPPLETAWPGPDQTNYGEVYALVNSLIDFIDL
ncbi:MAG TPA: hypothetical protein VFF59_11655, partial [Anaerolineae bacterium]|nr:hypothetical protein [Anaerolineae bacterium]